MKRELPTRTLSSQSWPLTLRPLLAQRKLTNETREAFVEITAPSLYRRIGIPASKLRDSLIALIRNQSSKFNLQSIIDSLRPIESPKDLDNLRYWLTRGWGNSLRYYLASCRATYLDMVDHDGSIRSEVIGKYIANTPIPTRVKPEGVHLDFVPAELQISGPTTGEVLLNRRTVRKFTSVSNPHTKLQQLLSHALAEVKTTRELAEGLGNRGALLSFGVGIDFYLVIYGSDKVQPGVYFYNPSEQNITLIQAGSFREEMRQALQEQNAPSTAEVTIILTADFQQYQWRYRHERAFRNLFVETGRIAQRLIVSAGKLGMGAFVTPATSDSEVGRLLHLDKVRQFPLYTVTIGGDPRVSESRHSKA